MSANLAAFRGQWFVVKIGGELVKPGGLDGVAEAVRAFAEAGVKVCVVHGGGPQATALTERLGLVPVKIAGRRVTDDKVLQVMKMTLAGEVSVDVVAELRKLGVNAVGLHGVSGHLIHSTRRPPKKITGGPPEPVDLGLVGDVHAINVHLLDTLAGEVTWNSPGSFRRRAASIRLAAGGWELNMLAAVSARHARAYSSPPSGRRSALAATKPGRSSGSRPSARRASSWPETMSHAISSSSIRREVAANVSLRVRRAWHRSASYSIWRDIRKLTTSARRIKPLRTWRLIQMHPHAGQMTMSSAGGALARARSSRWSHASRS